MISTALISSSRRVASRAPVALQQHGGVLVMMNRMPRHSQAAPANLIVENSAKHFSSESSSGGIRGWMDNRRAKKEQEQYVEQMERLSNMDALTLENYQKELEQNMNFFTNISFMQTKEIKIAKEVIEVVSSFIEVLGKEARADDLIKMDRLQRLQVATASNKTVEEIAIMVSQIQNMDLMQRTLRKRRDEGKPIPKDPQSMQAAIKQDAISVMTKTQKDMMKNRQAGQARRAARRRR